MKVIACCKGCFPASRTPPRQGDHHPTVLWTPCVGMEVIACSKGCFPDPRKPPQGITPPTTTSRPRPTVLWTPDVWMGVTGCLGEGGFPTPKELGDLHRSPGPPQHPGVYTWYPLLSPPSADGLTRPWTQGPAYSSGLHHSHHPAPRPTHIHSPLPMGQSLGIFQKTVYRLSHSIL